VSGRVASRPRVLVIRFGSLGDVVLATAVLEALAAETPAAEVDFVTKEAHAALFDGDPRVARVIRFRRRLAPVLSAIVRTRYDRVYDLHATARSRLAALVARAPEKRTVDKRSRERRALLRGADPSPRLDGGVVGWYGELLGRALPRPRLDAARRGGAARALLAERGVARGSVAVAPGARRATKAWPPRLVADFVRAAAASDRDRPLHLVGGPEEAGLVAELSAATGAPFVVPPLDLLPGVLAETPVLVTGDSAPLHVAEAVGTPVIALFGPTVAAFGFAPRDPRSTRIEVDLSCRPCSLHGEPSCPLGHHLCLAAIEPSRVVDALREALALVREPAFGVSGGAL